MKCYIIIMYMVLMLLTGCSGQQTGWQTGDVILVRAIGVDRLDTGVRISAAAGRSGSDVPVPALQADGVSVADGVRELGTKGDGFVHLGHANQLLMGEAFVQDGAGPLLDFIARDRQIGPGARLWVLQGGTAEQGVAGDVAADASARLVRLAEAGGGAGPEIECTATRLMSAMARRGSVPVPALRWEGDTLQPVGYAVLRQGRLVGFLDREQSLGVELLCGRGANQVVTATLSNGERIGLRTKRTDVLCTPNIRNGRLQNVEVRCTASLDVVQGGSLTTQQRQQVGQQVELELCRRMAGALAFAQFWNADFIDMEQMVRSGCSAREWDGVDWDTEFRTLSLRAAADIRVAWPPDMMEEEG